MNKRRSLVGLSLLSAALFCACGGPKTINDAALRGADQDSGNWLMYGRTYDDHRFSPLKQIDEQTVGKLGLAWSRELGTTRGLEATPLVKDGVIYTTSSWSVVDAIDAKSGSMIWSYDPKVVRERAYFFCCDVVNRGVALFNGKVYVATLDGRLIALDEKTGKPVWNVTTADNPAYSITSAPRIAKGMVVIGNAGSENGVRGFISAYDAETGKMAWRTYTVPGDPAKPAESKALEAAAKTWKPGGLKTGGGGSPWEGIVYDPELDLLYFGTGNPNAWYRAIRGEGDSLYTASILAVHASSGELAWYFQTTPGDNFDYDATQPLMQADLTIGGKPRKVIMQANKNGFFYVLDRATGEFISGEPFVSGVTWATGLDPKTGRPIEAPEVATMKPVIVSPSPDGAHNWYPMAFSPATGLVYFPAKTGQQFLHAPDPKWQYDPNRSNLGLQEYDGPLVAKLISAPPATGALVAWDPVNQKAAWTAKYPVVEGGGVLATAGNLVFQGRADGVLAAYRANNGEQLWKFDAGTGIIAPPVTYTVDGIQYLTVMVGWGGSDAQFNAPGQGPIKPGYGRILTFTLNGNATLKTPPFGHTEPPVPAITEKQPAQLVHQGDLLYNDQCAGCHGINVVAGPLPDLRYASKEIMDGLEGIVLGGSRANMGMPSFAKILNASQVQAIKAYIVTQSQAASSGQKKE